MINLYLLGKKGFLSLKSISSNFLELINYVIIGKDKNVVNDYSNMIIDYCIENNITYLVQNKTKDNSFVKYSIAIGWRWMIRDKSKLIVFHDSVLPKLRGFNPLVTSLINGYKEIGVTVLYGTDDFDRGEIILQKKINITYPLKIQEAIDSVSLLYGQAIDQLLNRLKHGTLTSIPQDELLATYSLWRDNEDYIIDWSKSSDYIKRFIDAVGYPYKGAFTTWNSSKYYIKESFIVDDVLIENRTPGKVLFKKENMVFIVCGIGLLCVQNFFNEDGQKININNFRIRFK